MYGTRDAPQNWSWEVGRVLTELGFQPGRANTCIFFHPGFDIRCTVHVDDSAAAGSDSSLRWLQAELSKLFPLKAQLMGPGRGDVQEAKYLNRRLQWAARGD